RFEILHASRVCSALVILACAARAARVALTPAHVGVLLAAVIGGTMLLLALTMMTATLSFWHTRTGKLQDFVQSSGREFAKYPLTLYPTSVRWILTIALPLAL